MRETLHPANRLDRRQRHEAFWQARKKKFFLVTGILAILLQLLFLGNMSYLYGSLWKSTSRYHAFEVLYVDYDAGIVGQSVNQAYHQLQGPSFPTLVQHSRDEYPSTDNVVNAVKKTKFWAAFITNQNASERLALALQGGKAAQAYDPSTALTYVWNEVRYPPFSDEAFEASFEALAAATRLEYNKLNGTKALQSMNKDDPGALQVLFNPIMTSAINIMPTEQATKLFYNTVSLGPMPVLQNFFYLLVLNGISFELQLYSKLPLHISGLVRLGMSVVYDLLASVSLTGYIWAFRESWSVTANQFVLTWMILWLFFHIHYLYLDACTAIFPLPALPFILLTWIIINITSTISPFEINPAFYKWSYALPAKEVYNVLQDIWSGGAVPQLHRALPILFVWWVVGLGLATYGHFYRCHKAWIQDAKMEKLINAASQESSTQKPEIIHDCPPKAPPLTLKTPSEAQLEAAEQYRSAYGPSIPPPIGLWNSFAAPDSPHTYQSVTWDGRNGSSGRESLDPPPLSLWKSSATPDSPYTDQSVRLSGANSAEGRESSDLGRMYEDEDSTILHDEE